MYQLGSILQHVVDGFYDASLAQHHPVVERYQLVFHIHPQSCHQLYPVLEQAVEQFLRDIPLVGKQLAIQPFCQYLEHLRILVAHVCPGKQERDNLTPIIASQMQLEAVAPTHCPLAIGGNTLEHLVCISSEVVAYGYHR